MKKALVFCNILLSIVLIVMIVILGKRATEEISTEERHKKPAVEEIDNEKQHKKPAFEKTENRKPIQDKPVSAESEHEEPPLIGISSSYGATTIGATRNVVLGVAYRGATPIIVPATPNVETIERYVDLLDGLVLIPGRADILPSMYGEKKHPKTGNMNKVRCSFEIKLIQTWLEKTKKPIMGICLGMQFANVACGGTLIQHIPDEVPNAIKHSSGTHEVTIDRNSHLFRILKTEKIQTNSYHHQAVEKLGKGLRAVAHTEDGVIEAIELKDRYSLLLQWHPEIRWKHGSKIFKAFVEAVKAHRDRKKPISYQFPRIRYRPGQKQSSVSEHPVSLIPSFQGKRYIIALSQFHRLILSFDS